MLLHKLNSLCNNCINYTKIDPQLQNRNLHPHVFSICRKINVFPTQMDIEKDTVKVSLINKATLTVHPDKEQLEMNIPKENIENWDDLISNLKDENKFMSKEMLHDIISKYDERDIRFHSARIRKDTSDIEISMYDYHGNKKNMVESIILTPQGINIKYKYEIPYDLYKAFNMSIYKY